MNTVCVNSNPLNNTACGNFSGERSRTRSTVKGNQKKPASIFATSLTAIKAFLVRRYNERINRQAFDYLLTVDDNILNDIGVTREDVLWASQLPLKHNASAELANIARRRKRV